MSAIVFLLASLTMSGPHAETPDTVGPRIVQRFTRADTLPRPQTPDRWLAEDKARHFFLSFAAASMAHGAARAAGLEDGAALAGAGALALGLGVWKELRDRGMEGETASLKDLVWDGLGVAAALGLAAGT